MHARRTGPRVLRWRRPTERAGGFTLIEVVLATALAATLMIAILGVTATLGRTHRAMTHTAASRERHAELIELLRRDLSHAQETRLGKNRVELVGFGSLDPSTLEPAQRPARVVYRLGDGDGASLLVREQTLLDEPRHVWNETVGWGVAAFELVRAFESTGERQATGDIRAGADAREVRVRIQWADGRQWQELIRVR